MAAFLYSEASAINAEGNTNHSGARTAEGNPWASMASPCRAGAGGGDPGASVASHPSAAAAASGDPVTSRASPFRHGWRRWWMVRRVQGVPSTTAAGAGGSVIQRVRGPLFHPWWAWGWG